MEIEDATNPDADADENTDDQLEGVAEGDEALGEDNPDTDAEADQGQADDETEEVEHEGAKYRIPKALKPALMMQADYTKKTQEVAEIRRAVEAEKAAVTQRVEAIPVLIAEHAAIHTMEQQLRQYEEYDWEAAERQAARIEDDQEREATLATLRAHERAFNALPRKIAAAQGELSKKEQARLQEQQQAAAKALEETEAVLSRDIPGWGRELVQELVGTAGQYGVSVAELREMTDPRLWKVLNDLHQARKDLAKQKTAQVAQKQAAVKPAAPIRGGSFSGAGVHDNLPPDEWMRRRNAVTAKKRAG